MTIENVLCLDYNLIITYYMHDVQDKYKSRINGKRMGKW